MIEQEKKVLLVLWLNGRRIGSTFEPLEVVKPAYAKLKLRLELIQQDMPGVVYPNDGHQTVFHYNVVKDYR